LFFSEKFMRNLYLVTLAMLLCSGNVPAQHAATTQPAAGRTRAVLVLPFSAPSSGKFNWIGQSIREDLLADLTPHVRGNVLAPADAAPAPDPRSALDAARRRDASIVVFGNAEAIGEQVRITGQVLDVASGSALAGLKATGPGDNLFGLQDALAAQVVRAIPHNLLTPQSMSMLRRDAVPSTFRAGPLGGSDAPQRTQVILSPTQPLYAPLTSWPQQAPQSYLPPHAGLFEVNPPAYPFSYYHPYLSSYYSPDVFLFLNVRHGR
jgi:TolB-like protein